MQQHDFLVEIHTEELPPKTLHTLAKHFCEGIQSRLQKAELAFKEARLFATPRRLAVLVSQLAFQQADKLVERKGPALDRAFTADGKPTSACEGFAKSCGITVADLITLDTPQGKFVGSKQSVTGKNVFELLPAIVTEALAALPVAKPMRWGSYSQKFIRPVHSVLMLYGDKVIDAEVLGCKTGRKTRGHRFLSPEWIEIANPSEYEKALENACVLADFEKRKQKIEKEAHTLATQKQGSNASVSIDPSLLDEVTSIVEWPVAISGSFDKQFLQVPYEALVSAMQDHQRYFPVFDQQHKLLPCFIAISNIENKDLSRVVAGNERVLRARLSDAAFFFETDKKVKLETRVETLKHIIFQNKLGTLFDKTERIEKLAAVIALQIHEDVTLAKRAALLSKTDLTTNLVGEFPELQGIAGYYYALADGENSTVAKALDEQYMPRFSGASLPSSGMGCILALADRIDTLVGVFGINQAPTGDKDPFGLRRAALGVLRILIEKPFNLDLRELITDALKHYSQTLENKNVIQDTLNFILDRLKPWYQEQNIPAQVIASVMSLNLTKPYDIHCRIQAVMAFKKMPEAESLSTANKRVSNILSKYDGKISNTEIKSNLFESDAERELATQLDKQAKLIETLSQEEKYQDALTQLAHLRVPVDNFFDHVMVMTDDQARRENRLLLLRKLRELFLHVADIALLQ